VNRVALGRHAQFFVTNPGQGADIAGLKLVVTNDGLLCLHDFFFCERDQHAQDLGAIEEALGVLFQPENSRAVHRVVRAYAFKSTAAVVQGMGQHVDLGVAPIHHLAVHPNFAVAVCH